MKNLIAKSFCMIPPLNDFEYEKKVALEVYNKKFEIIHNHGHVDDTAIVTQLLQTTSSNFRTNKINGIFHNFYCCPVRESEGSLLGYIIFKIEDDKNSNLHQIIIQLIANQTSLIIENDEIKNILMTQKINLNLISLSTFTKKEILIYKRLVLGESDCEIASVLNISKSTLRMHLRNIFDKIDVTSRSEAIAKYYLNYINSIKI